MCEPLVSAPLDRSSTPYLSWKSNTTAVDYRDPVQQPPTKPVELQAAGGLNLRPLCERHLDQVLHAFTDPVLARWNPLAAGPEGVRAATLDYIERRADWSSGTHASWGVFGTGRPEDEVLGSISIHRIDVPQGRAEIGYWTSPSARGRGVATGAVRAVVGWGFEQLNLFRIALTHAVANEASCRVAGKVGFALEGVMRASFVYGDGRRHDEHLHGLLRSDPPWPTLRGRSRTGGPAPWAG